MPADPISDSEGLIKLLYRQNSNTNDSSKHPTEPTIIIKGVENKTNHERNIDNDDVVAEDDDDDDEEEEEDDSDIDDIGCGDSNKKDNHINSCNNLNKSREREIIGDVTVGRISGSKNIGEDNKETIKELKCGVKEGRDEVTAQRVFKKSAPNNKMTLYLSSRDLVVGEGKIEKLVGLLHLHEGYAIDGKIYGQITLTFRYGREDEEVMGLKFCNEAVMCLSQLYPPHPAASQPPEAITPLQAALSKRLSGVVVPFSMEITALAPPSVQLVPAKEYNGAPIGTSYDIRTYVADKLEEKLQKRTTIKMGIRVVQRAAAPPSPLIFNPIQSRHRSRHAQNPKIPLLGCKSAPLSSRVCQSSAQDLPISSTQSLDSATSRKNRNSKDKLMLPTNYGGINGKNMHKEKENHQYDEGEIGERRNSIKTPTHVSFKDQLLATTTIEHVKTSSTLCQSTNGPTVPQVKIEDPYNNTTSIPESLFENKRDEEQPPCGGKRPSLAAFLAQVPAPHITVEKPFLLSDGLIELEASLDKGVYSHGEEIQVSVQVRNFSSKTVKRIKVFVVQYVDVCMFSNGKFKNVVASINSKEDCPVGSNSLITKTYILLPEKGVTKNWIALEDSYTKSGTSLASTVTPANEHLEERNVFAIYVTYYVKVKLLISLMGGQVSLKLPFTLMHTCSEFDPTWSKDIEESPTAIARSITNTGEIKPEKDGT